MQSPTPRRRKTANAAPPTPTTDWSYAAYIRAAILADAYRTLEPTAMPTAIELATADVAQIETALAVLAADSAMRPTFDAALATALANLAGLVDADAALSARLNAIDAANAGVLALPEAYRAVALAAALAAIDAEYLPTPPAIDAAPPIETVAAVPGRALNPRTVERNAAVASTEYGVLAAPYLAAFDRTDAADCNSHRDAGTRFPSFVALATDGPGVKDAGQYRTVATAVRLAMRDAGYSGVGQSVAESAWLARRNQYSPTGKKAGEYAAKCFHSGASIALYADGMYRLARPGTAGVRWLATDNAAWAGFIGSANVAASTPTDAASTPTTANVPTPPIVAADAYGHLTAVAKCVRCGASNLATANVCRGCKRYPRIDAELPANIAPATTPTAGTPALASANLATADADTLADDNADADAASDAAALDAMLAAE